MLPSKTCRNYNRIALQTSQATIQACGSI
uniref:Uncharacterized protein n=1 Tax=Arundo donax TaxID=35708 RepID=A0A0A8Z4C3_ARUDO